MARIAFLGGTGEEGLGLALRFALAGEDVIIGSRQLERAHEAAASLRATLRAAGSQASVEGLDNRSAVGATDIVAFTFPFKAVESLVAELHSVLDGKTILDVVNPLSLRGGVFHSIPVAQGSAGQLIQHLLPNAKVVSGFKNLSAKELLDLQHTLRGDVLLCGDHPDATQFFSSLVGRITALRAVDAGSLVNAGHLEGITTLLLNLNRRFHAITSIEVLGLPAANLPPR
jgi:8-hydroxy-5-deazaflavin:NADPH oxidoreductase